MKYFLFFLITGFVTFISKPDLNSAYPTKIEMEPITQDHAIQVALLLDTSNSMDGLIEQAKSRLWNIVNTLTTLKYNGERPAIEIALYEYGNDGLSSYNNYIRQVTPLTSDLDLISEKLFTLKTNGGSEYCGAVIDDALENLKWNDGTEMLKLIYIAGNEPFDQGPIDYRKAIKNGRKSNVYVNTILCGNRGAEEMSSWREGASIGKGEFFTIDSDKVLSYIKTPYDERINQLNSQLNETYYGYGKQGQLKKQNQLNQDYNAGTKSMANKVERAVSKSKHIYDNATWDLVDKYKDDKESVINLSSSELPDELKGKSKAEIEAFILAQSKLRNEIQIEIGKLSEERDAYIAKEKEKHNVEDDLGEAINQSIIKLATIEGYRKN